VKNRNEKLATAVGNIYNEKKKQKKNKSAGPRINIKKLQKTPHHQANFFIIVKRFRVYSSGQ